MPAALEEVGTVHFDGLTPQDYAVIVDDLHPFWGSDRLRHLHHPMFVHEFADSALAARDDGVVVGYLIGFRSQTAPLGYVHLVAVRDTHRGAGVGRRLYARFAALVRDHGMTGVKAITTPTNAASVAFHRSLGFTVERVPDHAGPDQDRMVMTAAVHDLATDGRRA